MKRGIISFCLLVALLFGASIGVAADTEYYIEEGGFTVTVPDGYHVLHRDIAEDDPVLDVLGMTASDLVADMEEGQLYLDMFDEEVHYEITITVFSDEDSESVFNLADMSDNEILSFFTESDFDDSEMDVDFDGMSIIGVDDCKFLQLPYTYFEGGTEVSALRNYTIVNGQYIIMDVVVYDPAFYNEATGLLSSLTNSLRFDEIKDSPLPEDSERTEGNTGIVAGNEILGTLFSEVLIGAIVTVILLLLVRLIRGENKLYRRAQSTEIYDEPMSPKGDLNKNDKKFLLKKKEKYIFWKHLGVTTGILLIADMFYYYQPILFLLGFILAAAILGTEYPRDICCNEKNCYKREVILCYLTSSIINIFSFIIVDTCFTGNSEWSDTPILVFSECLGYQTLPFLSGFVTLIILVIFLKKKDKKRTAVCSQTTPVDQSDTAASQKNNETKMISITETTMNQLQELTQLLSEGIITQEEYEAKKKDLLEGSSSVR